MSRVSVWSLSRVYMDLNSKKQEFRTPILVSKWFMVPELEFYIETIENSSFIKWNFIISKLGLVYIH